MKTLTKLNINSEKVIKNEELMCLRGGYGSWDCSLYENGNYVGSVTCYGDTPPIAANEGADELNRINPGHDWSIDCGC